MMSAWKGAGTLNSVAQVEAKWRRCVEEPQSRSLGGLWVRGAVAVPRSADTASVRVEKVSALANNQQ